MDVYPLPYVEHNLPLILLSGLGSRDLIAKQTHESRSGGLEGGFRLAVDLPMIETKRGDVLLLLFLEIDGQQRSWNGKGEGPSGRFRVKAIGREYTLPPRKAALPLAFDPHAMGDVNDPHNSGRGVTPVLHSPLSPLSPISPTFPDGLMTPLWFEKHQNNVPACFFLFFTLPTGPEALSLDNHIKSEFIKFKKSVAASMYKSRFVAIAIGQKSILEAPDTDERLESIRRASGIDVKQFFFVPPDSSDIELRTFVLNIFNAVEPSCVDYYRDSSKHTRRKRNRGSIPAPTAPPTSGTSQTLSSHGWNVRYLVKLGTFAEFRQEMDAAGRNYDDAYEGLFSQDVFGSIASWSPRWNETRLLADILAIRMIRCHLWNEQPTLAVRRWQQHLDLTQTIIDQKGKGSDNYGWEAWVARWSTIMAELIIRSDLGHFKITADDPSSTLFYSNPEKAIPIGERLHPQELLHHPGYWLQRAVLHAKKRRKLAKSMPEEDRAPPGQSPASQVASRSYTYDTYLCPDPHNEWPVSGAEGFSHSDHLLTLLHQAAEEYKQRGQSRKVDQISLEVAQEYSKKGDWIGALKILRHLWQTNKWRKESWFPPLGELCLALRDCAIRTGDGGTILAVEWELLSDVFTARFDRTSNFHTSLDNVDNLKVKPAVVLRSGEVKSFISADYAFLKANGNVGDVISSQLFVQSKAQRTSKPITFNEISIRYEQGLRVVILRHKVDAASKTASTGSISLLDISLKDTSDSDRPSSPSNRSDSPSGTYLLGYADLTFSAGDNKIFNLAIPLREEGEGKATSITFSVAEKLFDLDYIADLSNPSSEFYKWSTAESGLKKIRIGRERPSSINILPRPPKLQLKLANLKDVYHTNESIGILLEITNEEESEAAIELEARLVGHDGKGPSIRWQGHTPAKPVDIESTKADTSTRTESQMRAVAGIGKVKPSETQEEHIEIDHLVDPAEFMLEIKAVYQLLSDPETKISKKITHLLPVVSPFEANYDFSPRLHPKNWPSYFQLARDESPEHGTKTPGPVGLAQKWYLTASVASFAVEDLIIQGISLTVLAINGGGQCNIHPENDHQDSDQEISPSKEKIVEFDVEVVKHTLEDRRSVGLDLSLDVSWRRKDQKVINITPLTVPRLLVTAGEPRVLASVQYSQSVPRLIHLNYTFENPTMHLLTFSLVMEPDEDFAVSGAKVSSLQLLPLSRETVRFNIMPIISGAWIQPHLKVVDRYFNKTLRVSATEGMKADRKGILVWVNADS